MTALKILRYPHKDLRKTALEVSSFDEKLAQTIQDMVTKMYLVRGWGLAATQIGILSRFFVMDISSEQNQPLCCVNPQIIASEGQIESEEDCLSLPGLYLTIVRAKQITLQYQDVNGNQHTQTFEGLSACCIQHEIDHLNGKLIIDHLSNLKRTRLMKKYEKMKMQSHCGDSACGHDHSHDHMHDHDHHSHVN